jgi:hypothetical protein
MVRDHPADGGRGLVGDEQVLLEQLQPVEAGGGDGGDLLGQGRR